ncbi:MAG: hypothetical protein KAH44_04360 [Oricola sp.]|jgi:hypothetical protein|nr:hypothetical protein [Oricola sp.]
MKNLKKTVSLAMFVGALCLAGCSEAGDAATDAKPQTAPQSEPAKAAKTGGAKASALGEETLAYPDDLQMTMLAYRLTGRQPPLEDWAAEEYDVIRADEFNKAQKLAEETARLAAIYEATEHVGYLQYRLRSQLSQYDGAKGGYYLTAFSPGQQTTFSGRESVSVQLDNMSDAFFWAMGAAEAQEILAHTSRNVTIDVKVRLTGTERRSSGILIKGRIAEYGVYSQRYNDERLLAQFDLD